METPFCRTEKMFGEAAMRVFFGARVAVFGAGGVGGYTIEALARAGIGALDIVDSDAVSISNINRQIIATHATVGMQKTEAFRQRIATINPDWCRPVPQRVLRPGNGRSVLIFAIRLCGGRHRYCEWENRAGFAGAGSWGADHQLHGCGQ